MSKQLEYLHEDEHISTSDLGLAAALLTLGHSMSAIDRDNPKRSEFIFQKDAYIETDIKNYWNSTLRMHFDNIKLLKNRLYNS